METLLDGFAGLSPKLKERANRRGEALQEEIEALRRDLCDLRGPWDHFKAQLRERKAALDKAVSTLNEEGQHRQKAEALRSVVGEIVCHFQDQGKRRKLVSIEVVAVEGGDPAAPHLSRRNSPIGYTSLRLCVKSSRPRTMP